MPISSHHRMNESRVHVPFSWVSLYQNRLDQAGLLEAVRHLPSEPLIRSLIALLQFGEALEPSSSLAFPTLDQRLPDLFPVPAAKRTSAHLESADQWIFFSKWQLLLAIKLACAFGSTNAHTQDVNLEDLLHLLLMVNDFYPGSATPQRSHEADVKAVQEAILRQYALVQHENPHHLIGRYAEIYGELAAPSNKSKFPDWIDIRETLQKEFGIGLEPFKAILFALYTNAVAVYGSENGEPRPQFRSLNLDDWFSPTLLSQDQWAPALDILATDPEGIKREHIETYGDSIGNPIDLGPLLRKPVLRLGDNTVSAVSGHLLIQRYTCGLYWDIHDTLPDADNAQPNRRTFQRFFGGLHEKYCRSVLRRIVTAQEVKGRKIHHFGEDDYGAGPGSNPDNLIVEVVNAKDKRCLLFESKVGRPRYKKSIVEADIEAFQEDLASKIGDGLDQEIDLCRRLVDRERTIDDHSIHDASRWFFVLVVTDPFPSMGLLLEPLREQLAAFGETVTARLFGPFIVSLSELEQLEMLPESRISDLLIEWHWGLDKDWPFNTFFAHRTQGMPIANEYVAKMADKDLDSVPKILFGHTGEREMPE